MLPYVTPSPRHTGKEKDALRAQVITLRPRIELLLISLRQLEPGAYGIRTLSLSASPILLRILTLERLTKSPCDIDIMEDLSIRGGLVI